MLFIRKFLVWYYLTCFGYLFAGDSINLLCSCTTKSDSCSVELCLQLTRSSLGRWSCSHSDFHFFCRMNDSMFVCLSKVLILLLYNTLLRCFPRCGTQELELQFCGAEYYLRLVLDLSKKEAPIKRQKEHDWDLSGWRLETINQRRRQNVKRGGLSSQATKTIGSNHWWRLVPMKPFYALLEAS